MAKSSFLVLSEEETIQAGLLDIQQGIATLEEVFNLLYLGDYCMGGASNNLHGVSIHFPDNPPFPGMPANGPDRRFMAMPAYIGGKFNATGNKWYGSNQANKAKGLPRSIHTIVLNDTDTGEPLAFMSGTLISSMRTGLVPAVAAKHTALKPPKVLGLVGAGVINKATLLSMAGCFDSLEEVRVYDISPEACERYCQEMGQQLPDLYIHPVDTLEASYIDVDINHNATSGKNPPFLKAEWMKPGAVITISGRVRFDDEFLVSCNNVLDSKLVQRAWYADEPHLPLPTFRVIQLLDESKKLQEDEVLDLGAIIAGKADPKYYKNGRTTIFQGQGIPVYDVAFAWQIYQKALEMDLGVRLSLWQQPHWI